MPLVDTIRSVLSRVAGEPSPSGTDEAHDAEPAPEPIYAYSAEERQVVTDSTIRWMVESGEISEDEVDEYVDWLSSMDDDELQGRAEHALIRWVNQNDDLPDATTLAEQQADWPNHVDELEPDDWPSELYASIVERKHVQPGALD